MEEHLQQAEPKLHASKFDVLELPVPRRDGGSQAYQIVKPNDAVVLLPLLDAERVVLIQNRRHAVGKTLWELPAGTLEQGEDPADCAGRELVEETGYAAGKLTELTAFYTCPGFCTEKLTAFLAEDLTEAEQNLDDTEHIEPQIVTMEEALTMIRDRRIEDAKTIATLLFYRARDSRALG